MKYRVFAALLTASVAAAMSGCAASETKSGSGKGDIKIGASIELSGPTASIGTTYDKALKLKVKQLNDAGGVDGRKIDLIVRDNQTNPAEGLKNVNEFIDNDHVAAIISGGCSACIINGKATANEKKVPVIALASASAITNPPEKSQYIFKIAPNPSQDAAVIVNDLKAKGVHRIALISVNNVYGQDGQKQVSSLAQAAGINVVDTEHFDQADKDMQVQVGKMVAARPDAVVAWSVMPAAGIIASELKDAKFAGKVYLDAGAGAELFVKGAQAKAEGTYMVFPSIMAINDVVATTPQVTAQKDWYKAYTSEYRTYSGFASFAADAVQMIANAVHDTNGTDPQKIRDDLDKMSLDGMTGPIKMTSTDHSGLQPDALKILVVRNGEWRLDG